MLWSVARSGSYGSSSLEHLLGAGSVEDAVLAVLSALNTELEAAARASYV